MMYKKGVQVGKATVANSSINSPHCADQTASQSLTYIKSRIQPQILSQLQEVENLSHHSFKKVYAVRKEATNT